VTLISPPDVPIPKKIPTERAIAAAANVRHVEDAHGGWERFDDKNGRSRYDRVYEIK